MKILYKSWVIKHIEDIHLCKSAELYRHLWNLKLSVSLPLCRIKTSR